VKDAETPRYYNVRVSPTQGGSGRRQDDPGWLPHPPTRFDPRAILRAAFIGALGALAADLGAAAAFGPPITARDAWAAIVGGAAAGIAGEIVLGLGANPAVVAVVAGFTAGFVTEALFPEAPIPPRALDVPAQA
jgi:hypothetical protein